MAYTTTAYIAARLGASLTAEQEAYFDDVLSGSIDAYVNQATGTIFGSTDTVEVYVSGDEDSQFLIIPTMYDITAVTHVSESDDEEGIPIEEYTLYPRSEDSKYAIRRLSGEWEEGFDNYKISGKLGFETIPEEIKLVATELAAIGLNSMSGSIKSEKTGDYSVTFADVASSLSADHLAILGNYKRLSASI